MADGASSANHSGNELVLLSALVCICCSSDKRLLIINIVIIINYGCCCVSEHLVVFARLQVEKGGMIPKEILVSHSQPITLQLTNCGII